MVSCWWAVALLLAADALNLGEASFNFLLSLHLRFVVILQSLQLAAKPHDAAAD